MNDYPQDPNNPNNHQAPDPDQPVYEYEQVQEDEPYYEEYVEETPPKPFKRWLPHLIISGVSLLIAAGMTWHFRDHIKAAMGMEDELAGVDTATTATNVVADADNETGEFIIQETSSFPVEMQPAWAQRIKDGRNKHGIFYVPIATIPKEGDVPIENLTSADLVVKSAGVQPMKKFGFEDSRGEWQSHGNGIIVTSSDAANTGSSSLVITDRKSPGDYPQRDLSTTVEKGHVYRLTAYVQLKNKPEADIKLVVVQNGQDKLLVRRTCSDQKWTLLTGDFNCNPEGVLSSVHFTVQCQDASVDFFLDDVECVSTL